MEHMCARQKMPALPCGRSPVCSSCCEVSRQHTKTQSVCYLFRLVFLRAVYLKSVASVITYNNVSATELTCAMSGYAPPNSFLKWYRGSSVLSDGGKYTVLYRDNPDESIQRGSGMENGVLGVLVISNPADDDSGTYHCRIDGYNLEASVQLEVQSESGANVCLSLLCYMHSMGWCCSVMEY